LADLPGLPARLERPGSRFLDVGGGASGISIMMCRRHPALRVVGIDTSPTAAAVAREESAAAGLTGHIGTTPLIVPLPVDVTDPVRLLEAVTAQPDRPRPDAIARIRESSLRR
jgi:methylase of polypeptide subunit release factors